MGAIFNAQANHSPLLVTAGQQVRAQITMQANLTNRDAVEVPEALRQVDLRAAARRGRARRARPGHPPRLAAAARARPSSRCRWTTGTPRSTTPTPPRSPPRARCAGARRRRARARRATSPARLEAAKNPVHGRRARTSTPAARGTLAVALAEKLSASRVWASPATGGGRLGFPEGHPHFRGIAAPGDRPGRADARGARPRPRRRHLGLPLLPLHPGPRRWPRAPSSWRSPPTPTRRRARRWATRSSPTCARRSRRCSTRSASSPTASAPPPLGDPPPESRTDRPAQPVRRARTLREVLPDDGDRRARVALQHDRAAQPAAHLAARLLLLLRAAAASAAGSRPGSACRWPSPTGRSCACSARARRSTRSRASGPRPPTRCRSPSWSCATTEYAILKWFAEVEQVDGRARARPAGARHRRDRRGATACPAEARREPRRAARGARRGDRRRRTARARRGRRRARHVALLAAMAVSAPDTAARSSSRRGPLPRLARGRARPSRCAPSSSALLGADRVLAPRARPRPLRLRRQPLPADPPGGRPGPRRARRRQGLRLRPPRRHPGHAARRAGRASTARGRATGSSSTSAGTSRACALEDGGARVRVKPGTVLGRVNRAARPSTSAASAPTPRRPTSRRSAA